MIVYGKLGKRFYLALLILVGYFIIAVIRFPKNEYTFGGLWLFLVVILMPHLVKMIRFVRYKKPIFIVNEIFIFDHFENIQYYWDDIKEVIATDSCLEIQLYEPEKYLKKIKNPFRRLIAKIDQRIFKVKSYKIDLSLLAIEKGKNIEFLDTLNEYSLATS